MTWRASINASYPAARKSKKGKVHLVDALNAQQLKRRTSSKGEVEFKCFAAGDQVRLVLPRKDDELNIDFVVDDQAVQTVVVKEK